MKLKWFILFLLLVGLGSTMALAFRNSIQGPELCLFKHATGWPCPSCGSTRAVVHLWHGHFWQSLTTNPLGMVVFVLAWPALFLLLRDARDGGTRFEKGLDQIQVAFQSRPWLFVLLAFLLALNWGWNMYKFKHGITGF
jgi:hypothetical protein